MLHKKQLRRDLLQRTNIKVYECTCIKGNVFALLSRILNDFLGYWDIEGISQGFPFKILCEGDCVSIFVWIAYSHTSILLFPYVCWRESCRKKKLFKSRLYAAAREQLLQRWNGIEEFKAAHRVYLLTCIYVWWVLRFLYILYIQRDFPSFSRLIYNSTNYANNLGCQKGFFQNCTLHSSFLYEYVH